MTDIFLVVLAMSISFFAGSYLGSSVAHEAACKTVQAEWVKDKCMKVTREDVK